MSADILLIATCIAAIAALLVSILGWRAAARAGAPDPALLEQFARLHAAADQQPRVLRDETERLKFATDRNAAHLREELVNRVQAFEAALGERFDRLSESQANAAATLRRELNDKQREAAEHVVATTKTLGEFQRDRLAEMAVAQKTALDGVALELKLVKDAAAVDQEKARATITLQLDQLRKENEAKLEQMRATVDEKLQGTLEQRLGESFKRVSESLETVHKGLGEMQTLASGVGDLKRVLTNVKSRGSWGEVQLGALLEDMLTNEQYTRQAHVRPGSSEAVDYAIHLPGSSETGEIMVPVDCKFPQEDYERLMLAQDRGDPELIETAHRALDRAVKLQARSIAEKYIHPPHTTDFAIMYLPTEGLFAEVIRRPGLASELSQSYRVTITGPTTLSAYLTSLRMGFRTLAIQKNASDVMQKLGQAKAEFERYGEAWDAVDKKLDEAKKKVAEVGVRHRAVNRTLREVEAIEPPAAPPLLLDLPSPALMGEESSAA